MAVAGDIRVQIAVAAVCLLIGCGRSRIDADGRTPTDVVRLAMQADERGDTAQIRELSWFPPPVFEYEKRRAERSLKQPLGQTVMQSRKFLLGRMLGEYKQSHPGVYRVDYELTGSDRSFTWRNWRFVRKIDGRWRIVRSDAGEEYQVPVDEIGISPN